VVREGKDPTTKNFLNKEDLGNFERLGSIPYEISFDIPVSLVFCGNLFAGLVTCQAQLYTWGSNEFGQLGIDDLRVLQVKNPTPIKFE
jgi:alpha-tubulin suppressor-like RCC1 family protein